MSNLDLEEQEQLEQLKHFWRRWGNVISWSLVAVLLAWSGWNGWQWWQRDQAAKAAGMFDALEQGVSAGDVARVNQVFADLKSRYPGTAYAGQAGLMAARLQWERGQKEAARTSLTWVIDEASEPEYRTLAALRLAALWAEDKKFDEALKLLAPEPPKAMVALVDDRRGDVLQLQGKVDEAVKAYAAAWQAMPDTLDYRRAVEAKLIALGKADAMVSAAAPIAAASGASR
ncbi:MAG: YfgM family protein [Leptothrix ochracea]|uniref:YfgM family protein n=1 Tax=Leptothrix ochracea TaxID=735331 RepID=UPI0034E1FE5D